MNGEQKSNFSMGAHNLLIIVPHFRMFLKDQAILIQPHLNNISVMMPMPYFSSLVYQLPFINKYFRFLNLSIESNKQPISRIQLYSPKYFTLPVEFVRKRNGHLATENSMKCIINNSIKFDFIHAHFIDTSGYIGASIKEKYGVPLILTGPGGDVYETPFKSSWHFNLTKSVLSKADQVITVSRMNAKKLLTLGVPNSKIQIIPYGYDDKQFKPLSKIEARKKLNLPLNKIILLSVGHLKKIKGHTYLIEAMQLVLKKKSEFFLVLVGSGELKEYLEKKAKNIGINSNIVFIGNQKHEDIPLWMNACDIFIMPSLNEGFPTVIPEAMACGKPVIGTRVGGIPEAITSDDFGILVEPKNAKSLALAILDASDRNWDQDAILEHAYKYSWSHISKQILEVYRKVLV